MKRRHQVSIPFVVVVGFVTIATVGCGKQDKPQSAGETPDVALETAISSADDARHADGMFSPYVDADGKISLPKDYRKRWTHLGGWAVAKQVGEAVNEMHGVYTQPATIAAFNKTGEFPDGAVLVKEVRHAKADDLTTGHAAWSNEIKIWFVMIKDRKGRFADNDHWGDGWGWALFEAKDPTKNVSAGYGTSCHSCHVPAEKTDWVYTYGYPDLKRLKQE